MKAPRRKTKGVRNWPGLVEYLDRRLGSHMGYEPELQYWCPFCIDRRGDESRERRLRINTDKQVAMCFRCKWSGHLSEAFRDLNGGYLRMVERAMLKGEIQADYAEGVRNAVLKILYGDEVAREEFKPVSLPAESRSLTERHTGVYATGWKYLTVTRGVSVAKAAQFDVQFCVGGRYGQRLVFPIRMHDAQVYFTTRYCGDHRRKALNPANVVGHYTKTDVLMNFDAVIGSKVVAVVEGPLDCMAFPAAVGLLGRTISPVQVSLLRLLVEYGTEELVVGLDSDADSAALYDQLAGRAPTVTVLPLAHGDPFERRAELMGLMEHRRAPSVGDRVRTRLKRTSEGV